VSDTHLLIFLSLSLSCSLFLVSRLIILEGIGFWSMILFLIKWPSSITLPVSSLLSHLLEPVSCVVISSWDPFHFLVLLSHRHPSPLSFFTLLFSPLESLITSKRSFLTKNRRERISQGFCLCFAEPYLSQSEREYTTSRSHWRFFGSHDDVKDPLTHKRHWRWARSPVILGSQEVASIFFSSQTDIEGDTV